MTTGTPPPALEIRGLRAGYRGRAVLDGLDLTVAGGVTAVLGSSGCGKTTLLRSVAGFLSPLGGTVAIGGTVVSGPHANVPPRRRGVGYVPQEGALFPHLSVADNIGFGLGRRGADRRRRITELLDLVELPAVLAGAAPHELSGGQQQRVALARALAPGPRLVLLDEPFSSLDAGLREETGRAVVRALRASGAAALLVTHDQGEALSLADQVAVMAAGSFLQIAGPRDIYLTPSRPEVAAFLGNATLLDGKVGADRTGECALGAVAVRGEVAPGTVRFAVRAEQVSVVPLGEGVAADVLAVSYVGHEATVRCRLGDGSVVIARVPDTALPETGERVALRVSGALVAFPDQDGDAGP